ncbi:unnamed protein product [Mytilus coruscus]|uniref:Uncharacterized protein n=1 Tax=Mytilus coruscus TaxID=42192 RepID=A0A6J8DZ34_MYTCO|nr:unnamed protein product [Mytilus coruscus]
MHRDATTKKGHHFYGLEFSAESGKTYTAGLKEVCDGKAETYVSCTNQILVDIAGTGYGEKIDNTKSFMTDRSSTESKTNRLLSEQKSNLENNETFDFKCAMHPLLQFSDLCKQIITSLEEKDDFKTENLLGFVSNLFYKDGSGDPLYAATY